MIDVRRLIGSMDNLIAFEAAARHGNFTHAARELLVAQPAISRRIRELETSLTVQLFERRGTKVRLTRAGQEFFQHVQTALGTIQHSAATLPGLDRNDLVTLRVNVAAASVWLMPAMGDFYREHPDIRLHLVCIDELPDLGHRDFDIEIRFGLGDWPNVLSYPLLEERVFPVASPGFVAEHPINGTEDLLRAPLLQLADFTSPLMDWKTWLAPAPKASGELLVRRFTTYAMVLEAAALGHGVALGWEAYVQRPISRGELVALPIMKRTSKFQEYLVVRPEVKNRPGVKRTIDWLLALAARTSR